ncbi:LysM peptidoglycan-binding domain-containing protein [Pedobacter immunditicola]|uniref:LysM peptidoglycan-binding domain-containing protein n=1 Tax=Pedobacter immunditicola TaxID=3133440 RepID=UPI0030B607B0
MQKYFIILLLAIFTNLSADAAVRLDSIGVENLNGKKLILHKVVQQDTYYSISRKYNVLPKDVMVYNDNKFLHIGVIIKVPTQRSFTEIPSGSGINTQQPGVPQEESYTEHIVQKKENLNILAKKYGTTIDEIKRINKLNSINLSIGQVLKMPVIASPVEATTVNVPAIVRKDTVPATVSSAPVRPATPVPNPNQPITNKPITNKPVQQTPIQTPKSTPTPAPAQDTAYEDLVVHTVASNETIYSIATRYKMTIDQLKAKNNLSSSSLRVGQRLLIKGQYGQKKINPFDNESDTITLKDPSLRYAPSKYGLNQIDEKGTAIAIMDPDLDPNKMLVLHRSAPIGTVMKITNPMSNRSTFAKVVGKFTENQTTKDAIVVMTQAVADALGALDKRFFCNLTYSGQETNEQ